MAEDIFQFKQFSIQQDRCAMKVGTDGLMLGAWASAENRDLALDIGTGTGLLALMIAQRDPHIRIEAVEYNEQAAEQAKENFQRSEWSERIKAIHCDISDLDTPSEFDLIVSNPPYFGNGTVAPDKARGSARQHTDLDLDTLFERAFELAAERALFAVIYPFDQRTTLIKTAIKNGWHLCRSAEVKDTEDKSPVRILAEFSKELAAPVAAPSIVIRNADNSYHSDYIALTQDFHTIF